ncbi:Ig-like domain-containing protein [Vibrio sp. CAU 1672]|uniref:Ig-like domain-containing protein n=1 Tax=Vibrio sp. CAU 1672 TaxID=3032594 RepID=UPI0023DAB953|nr:Ig-like domain-containing protein [Vibrio sp. CAU 1672]MDF2154560.1 Ig-like domain-containing protein [Vibrio sp. CAU 1672]
MTLPTKGEQKTLVLLINFQENPNEQPLTLAEADSLVFGKVNDFYRENSFEQTWLSGQVAGWFTLPLSNQVCSLSQVRDLADEQAISAGVPLADYDRIVYLMTKTACGISGSASMEGIPSRAYINGSFIAKTIAHELGHNFGLHHSRALDCGEQTWSDQCTTYEYGDTYDVMGGPDIGYFNTFQKEQLGWLDGDHASKTVEVTQDGNYSIANYETQSNQPVTLKIPRGIDPVTGTMRWFYIEYRQSVGFDDFLDSRSYSFYRGDVTQGIIIRSATEGDARSSNLLHFKTDSEYRALTGANDWFDPAMPVGGSYTDPVSGVTLSLISAANGEAQVSVIFGDSGSGGTDPGGNTCTTSAPGLDEVAMTENAVAAGDTVQYLLTVTNRDSADCASTGFGLSAIVPAGWNSTSAQLTLAPGEAGQVVISVVSSADAVDKDYSLSVQAAHGLDSDASASTTVLYRVVADNSTSTPLVAVDDNVALTSTQSVTIDVLANDIVDEQASVSVISFTQPSKGRLERLADGTLRYTPEKRFKTSDSFSYTVGDGYNTSTAWVSIKLQASSDDGSSTGGSKPGKGNNK